MHSNGQIAAVLAFKNSSRKYIYEKVLNPGIWKLTEMRVGKRVWEIEQQNEKFQLEDKQSTALNDEH